MAKINLLPWREELRKEKQKEFAALVGFIAIVAVGILVIVHIYFSQLVEYHKSRNQYLTDEIAKLDKKIEEIQQLESEKDRLLARMRAIEQLQGNRPLIVHVFDEIVRTLPEGVSLVSLTQKGTSITINGVAQSNARVSNFMRNLDSSEWLKSPKLDVIQAKDESGQRIFNFTLKLTQVIPAGSGDEEEGGDA